MFYFFNTFFMQRIIIVEDHIPIGERLERYLNVDEEFDVVGRYLTAEEGMEAILKDAPDVVLSDFSLPGMSGLEMVKQLRTQQNTTPVVMFTLFTDAHIYQAALEAGVQFFLPKSATLEEIKSTLKEAGHLS
jgi:DNA-binding NarL/FixJ family response regulator